MTDAHDDDIDDSDVEPDDDESIIDRLRDSGVGVEDPNLTDPDWTELVDEQVQPDEPPQV